MSKNSLYAIILMLAGAFVYPQASQAVDINMLNLSGLVDKWSISMGHPKEPWPSPLKEIGVADTAVSGATAPSGSTVTGSSQKVSNDSSQNRCRLIKTIKPGADKVEEMQRVASILQGYYSSELYVQAMQTLYELDEEKAPKRDASSSQKAVLDGIKDSLVEIQSRLSIIASLEARIAVVDNITKLINLDNGVFGDYTYNRKTEECVDSRIGQKTNSGTAATENNKGAK